MRRGWRRDLPDHSPFTLRRITPFLHHSEDDAFETQDYINCRRGERQAWPRWRDYQECPRAPPPAPDYYWDGALPAESMTDPLGALWESAGYPCSEEEPSAMRLKLNVPLPEEKCLLGSRHVSPRYEDRLRSYRGLSERKSPSQNFLFRQSAWPSERGVACYPGSPDSNSVLAMSLSSSEPEDRDASDQENDEEEFEDTSPLLAAAKANILTGDAYGSVSDNSSAGSSDEEDSSEDSGLTAMNDQSILNKRIEPNNNFLDTALLESADALLIIGNDEATRFVTAEPVTAPMANVLSLNVGSSPTSEDYNDFSPMSEGSTASLASSLTSSITGMASMTSSTMSVDLVSNVNVLRDVWRPEDAFPMDKGKKTDANVRERAAVEDFADLRIVDTVDEFLPVASALEAEKFAARGRRKPFREDVRLLPDLLPPLNIMAERENVLDSAAAAKAEIDLKNASRRKHLLESNAEKLPPYDATIGDDSALADDVSRWTLPENVAKIFDKAELTREATTSAASLLNFTPEKVRRSRLSLPPPPPAGESFTDGGCPASVAATADPVAPAAGSNASKRKGRGSLSPERCGDFDVYNIETSMPTIDWDAMERHLSRAAKEDDWLARRRHDREAIRQKLAMDTDLEECFGAERPSRKPSLAVRLQESKNLQICFMNETAAELDSLELATAEDGGQTGKKKAKPSPAGLPNGLLNASANVSLLQASAKPAQSAGASSVSTRRASLQEEAAPKRPSFFFNRRKSWRQKKADGEAKKECSSAAAAAEERWSGEDFATRQARLQAEARAALAQAKEMARMQMEVERQQKKKSPIADIVGISFPDSRHRLSRQLLNDMNVAQLQVIVNDLHSQIESHNEDLVKFLLERDDLHMEQDSMLVDIEDMTRFLGAKNSSAPQDNPTVAQPLPAKAVPSK
ncbi:schwannomin interacting protein 1 isoform X2 [Haemaphysalis longicornis]